MCSKTFNLLFFSVIVLIIASYFTNNDVIEKVIRTIKGNNKNVLVLSKSELAKYNGKDDPKLYISILGQVYDVTAGEKHYGRGQAYNFFVGRDASRSFVDGDFENKKTCEDVTGLSQQEFRSLNNWIQFYKKSYIEVGKLDGKYYDKNGEQTPFGKEVHKLIKTALEEETEQDRLKLRYPSCNMEWDRERGTHVWCTDQSGGIKRNWIGVPRKFFEAGTKDYRCACIRESDLDTKNIEGYPGCDEKSQDCYLK